MSDDDEAFKTYQEDSRIPCRYGAKCYQKNPLHHEKYKHPPKKDSKEKKAGIHTTTGKKRKKLDIRRDKDTPSESPEKKIQKTSPEDGEDSNDATTEDRAPQKLQEEINGTKNVDKKLTENSDIKDIENPNTKNREETASKTSLLTLLKGCSIDTKNETLSNEDVQKIISELFLTEMPEDFYKFYKLCRTVNQEDPLAAFKDVQLKLVGPYDVLRDNFLSSKVKDKEDILRHWRYYYDPPEFQTIIKCENKNGLHYGYWRDEPSEPPVFVAKNEADVNHIIQPIADNIFGAVDAHIEEKLKSANPFEKTRIVRLQQRLRNFATQNDVTLEKKSTRMQLREKKVVARTFHKAGIVVPYDKKTQLGYRELALIDRDLQKLLEQIRDAETDDERKGPMSKLEEVVRLATIAADECDFGTCLELGHDLLAAGVTHVQNKALQMLSMAYTLLERTQFLEIAKAHFKGRKRGTVLSVL